MKMYNLSMKTKTVVFIDYSCCMNSYCSLSPTATLWGGCSKQWVSLYFGASVKIYRESICHNRFRHYLCVWTVFKDCFTLGNEDCVVSTLLVYQY